MYFISSKNSKCHKAEAEKSSHQTKLHLNTRRTYKNERRTVCSDLASAVGTPSDHVNLVYLDLNHWISLAQASAGHSKGVPFVKTLDACLAARSAGTALFVLSSTHYVEMLKIKDPVQRREIADVMEELTDFATLVSRVVVMELELAAMLDKLARTSRFLQAVPLVGRGVRHSIGLRSGLRIMSRQGDETDQVRERIGANVFDDLIAKINLDLERSVLRGAADNNEVENLSALGWNLEPVMQVAERRAAQEREQALLLDNESRWRRGRLRDVVSAREFVIEFQNILPRALAERGLVFADVIRDQEEARTFAREMPSTDVSIELKTAWHRNRDKPWNANDIYDIDAMSLAVPYCDIVVTEKACHHVLHAAHLGERMQTAILRDLTDLPDVLDDWKPTRALRN